MKLNDLSEKKKQKILKRYMAGEKIRDLANEYGYDYASFYYVISEMEGYEPRRYSGKYIDTIKKNKYEIIKKAKMFTKKELARYYDIPYTSFIRDLDRLGILLKEHHSILDKRFNQIRALRESGISYSCIAKKYDVSASCVSSFCIANNIEIKKNKLASKFANEYANMVKDKNKGMTISQIASRYKCSQATASKVLNRKIGRARTKGIRSLKPHQNGQ